MFDLAIRGAVLVDGSGAPRRVADVGIQGDRVVAVTPSGQLGAAHRDVDGAGKVLAPGFVDPHSHTDFTTLANRDAQSTIRQGVTTEVVGNCGLSLAPVTDESAPIVALRLRSKGYDGPPTWRTFADYLDMVRQGGISQNLAHLVGHSTVRAAAGVTGRTPSDDQQRAMRAFVAEAMEAGAYGLSSGLEYDLGALAGVEELADLAQVVARYGGLYASHIRNRDAAILDAIDEFLTVARIGNVPGQVSHLNVRHDSGAPDRGWERAVQLLVDARAQGLDVQADTTPFPHGLGRMDGLLPSWVYAGGRAGAAQLLADPSVRLRLRADCDRYWRFLSKGQWHRARMQNSLQFPEFNGRTIAEIAQARGQDPWDAYFDMLAAAGEAMGQMSMVGDLFTEEHLAEMVSHPLFSLGNDAYSSTDTGPLSALTQSPLPYNGHVYYLTHHVRERGTLTLEEAVRKMSGMPAARFGLRARGLVREGYFADLVLFDFDRLNSRSTFANPAVYPDGIDMVLVNGVVVVENGTHLGHRPGHVLRHR
ncbi:amidohydrolase family protein [Dactylosporangium sp. NPDC050688]|uniref:N-acyl-D-amino-acid deacylase family protein n=1 Tax=Dactylosporangium sp. NPDC050688 TaxID=3157217 RepID=UPI0033EA6D66